MNSTPNLVERFLSDTPTFFKKVHLLGLILVGLAVSLSGTGIPPKITLIAGVIGGTLSLISQFAVKDIAILQSAPSVEAGLANLIPELVDQFSQTKSQVIIQAQEILDAHKEQSSKIASVLQAVQELKNNAVPTEPVAPAAPPAVTFNINTPVADQKTIEPAIN